MVNKETKVESKPKPTTTPTPSTPPPDNAELAGARGPTEKK